MIMGEKTRTTIIQEVPSQTPATLSKTTTDYILPFYPNSCPPQPPI